MCYFEVAATSVFPDLDPDPLSDDEEAPETARSDDPVGEPDFFEDSGGDDD